MKSNLLAAASLLGLVALGAEVPKTILDLQEFRQTSSLAITSKDGKEGIATLINLNPAINVWYLLRIAWKDGTAGVTYHLENPNPGIRKLLLDERSPSELWIVEGKNRYSCDLFDDSALDQARNSRSIYAPLCYSRIYVRNPATGHRTTVEAATDFLRNQVWGGEQVIVLFHHLMGDLNRETGQVQQERQPGDESTGHNLSDAPASALIDERYGDRMLTSSNLGIEFQAPANSGMIPGAWYAANGVPGVYVSILQPGMIEPAVLHNDKTLANNLDTVESSSLCYLIAFDLSRFDLGFALGTEHPGVVWSDHIQGQVKDRTMPGPDGIGSIAPLVSTGLVSPENARKTVATFTGGFKREHGAFRYGDLALKNHGSHYGFIENGVVFSKLQPGLATILVLDDGSIEMKTWADADNRLLSRIKHARQNGVPVIEFGVPGARVASWGAGNWSGSEDEKLRTIRAGAAVQANAGIRFLIYAVFSDATPSAMARVFQAYRCDYAMLLDMNALEHTYLALYRRSGSQLLVEHLIERYEPGGQICLGRNGAALFGISG